MSDGTVTIASKRKWGTYRKKRTPKPKMDTAVAKTVITKAVKEYMARQMETKTYLTTVFQTGLTPALASVNTPYCLNLLPYISQGTGEGSRIGNTIIQKRGYINLQVSLNTAAAVTRTALPVGLKWWIVRNKQQNINTGSIGVSTFNSFFQGNGSSSGFGQTVSDFVLPENRDLWQVCDSGIRYFGLSAPSADFVAQASVNFTDDPPVQNWTVDFTRHLHKKLLYNDTTVNPTNDNLFLVVQVVYVAGNQPSGAASGLLFLTACVETTYTDA